MPLFMDKFNPGGILRDRDDYVRVYFTMPVEGSLAPDTYFIYDYSLWITLEDHSFVRINFTGGDWTGTISWEQIIGFQEGVSQNPLFGTIAIALDNHEGRIIMLEQGMGTPAQNLDDLLDVNTAGATTGQVLTFVDGVWIPAEVPGSVAPDYALNELTDVSTLGAANGQFLSFENGVWIPMDPPEGGVGGPSIDPPVLISNNATAEENTDYYLSAGHLVNLPASPEDGTRVTFFRLADDWVNNPPAVAAPTGVTIGLNQPQQNDPGVGSFELNHNSYGVTFIYQASIQNWWAVERFDNGYIIVLGGAGGALSQELLPLSKIAISESPSIISSRRIPSSQLINQSLRLTSNTDERFSITTVAMLTDTLRLHYTLSPLDSNKTHMHTVIVENRVGHVGQIEFVNQTASEINNISWILGDDVSQPILIPNDKALEINILRSPSERPVALVGTTYSVDTLAPPGIARGGTLALHASEGTYGISSSTAWIQGSSNINLTSGLVFLSSSSANMRGYMVFSPLLEGEILPNTAILTKATLRLRSTGNNTEAGNFIIRAQLSANPGLITGTANANNRSFTSTFSEIIVPTSLWGAFGEYIDIPLDVELINELRNFVPPSTLLSQICLRTESTFANSPVTMTAASRWHGYPNLNLIQRRNYPLLLIDYLVPE